MRAVPPNVFLNCSGEQQGADHVFFGLEVTENRGLSVVVCPLC